MTHSEYNTLIRQRYRNMQTRFATRRTASGRVTQIGREVPFTPEEFAEWILGLLGGVPSGRAQCSYCRHTVTVQDLEIDHCISPHQGGDLGFENLVPCCSNCNKQKGEMSDMSFRRLLHLVNSPDFRYVDRDNILGRLQRETKFIWGAHRKRRSNSNTVRSNPAGRLRLPPGQVQG